MAKVVLVVTLIAIVASAQIGVAAECDKGRTYFQQALKLPDTVGDLIKKEQLYKRAVEVCPEYMEARNNLGDTFEKQGRYEEAIAQYQRAADSTTGFAIAYFGLGDVYFKTNQPEQAIEWYNRGLKIDPNDSLSQDRLMKARMIVDDIRKAGLIRAETLTGILSTTRGPGEVVSITFGEKLIPFDFDKHDLGPNSRSQLNEIGKALKEILVSSRNLSVTSHKPFRIDVAGHTDGQGRDDYNLSLSRRRAETVVNYLVSNFGIPADTLLPKGYGKKVPLCSIDFSQGCHALNRRVEIVKVPSPEQGVTRSAFFRRGVSQPVNVNLGVFYRRAAEPTVSILDEEARLRSDSDRYFLFFRPLQDAYVYVIQKDSKNKIQVLFPQQGASAHVLRGKDYWVPSFGNAFTLDGTRGEEKIHFLATSWPLDPSVAELSQGEQMDGAIKGLETRTIKVVRPATSTQTFPAAELKQGPQKIEHLLVRVEGESGWVKTLRFWHD